MKQKHETKITQEGERSRKKANCLTTLKVQQFPAYMWAFLSYFTALLLRCGLIYYGQWQDERFDVKYTDIDYFVFTDAARFVIQGGSAFDRHTYRYTPLLAYLLTPNIFLHPAFGKVLFSIADVVTGVLLKAILQHQGLQEMTSLKYACIWMLNPLSMNISTRGSSESLITVVVLSALWASLKECPHLSGMALGVAVHLKIYPVIYTPALALYLLTRRGELKLSCKKEEEGQGFTWSTCFQTIKGLIKSFFTGGVVNKFCTSAAISFLFFTSICYYIDGDRFLWDGLFYHLSRTDHRHNFSIWWYPIYLDYDNPHKMTVGSLLLVPQLLLLVLIALVYAPKHLPFAVFLQTMVFVVFNKVFTGQYFSWYLSLLPLVLPNLEMSVGSAIKYICIWACALGVWLFNGYMLEFKGKHFYISLWICSLIFFFVNLMIVSKLVQAYSASFSKDKIC